jgi:hypothetical protein
MIQRKLNRLLPVGLLLLSLGVILHNWTHGRYSEFAGGFLIGMAIVFMIAGFVRTSKTTPAP